MRTGEINFKFQVDTSPPACLVIDDHPLVAQALADLFRDISPMSEVSAVTEAAAAIASCQSRQPALIICDMLLPGESVTKLCASLRLVAPAARLLLITGMATLGYAELAVACRADGLIAKGAAIEDTKAAIAEVLAGRPYYCQVFRPLVTRLQQRRHPGAAMLTPRERDVALRLAFGMNMSEIGSALRISYKTVDAHRGAAFQKLGVSSQRELMQRYLPLPQVYS